MQSLRLITAERKGRKERNGDSDLFDIYQERNLRITMTKNHLLSPHCVQCERTSAEVPLLRLEFKNDVSYICPQHLPVLIHKPHHLVGKLPGAENLNDEGHPH